MLTFTKISTTKSRVIMYLFALAGVLAGAILTISMWSILWSSKWLFLKDIKQSGYGRIDVRSVHQLFILITIVAQVMFWFSLMGFLAIKVGHRYAFRAYSGYIILATIIRNV